MFVSQRQYLPKIIIVEPQAAHKIGLGQRIVTNNKIGEPIICIRFAGFIIFIVALPFCQEEGGIEREIVAEPVIEKELVMILLVIVGFIVVRLTGFFCSRIVGAAVIVQVGFG